MSTNKTRLIIEDSYTNPDIVAQIEFDIYQEALDYAKILAYSYGSLWAVNNCYVYVLSYDNTSYRLQASVTSPYYSIIEIVFPLA